MLHVLCGKEKSNLNVFLDSTSNQYITQGIIQRILNSFDDVNIKCCTFSPTEYETTLKSSNHRVCDIFTDPLHWFSNEENLKNNTRDDSVIIIDDLLIYGRSIGCINKFGHWVDLNYHLHVLSKDHQVFVFVKADLTKETYIRSLQHLSTFYATFIKNNDLYECKSILKKKSGKVVSEINHFTFENGCLQIKKATSLQIKDNSIPEQEADPASNLTFNLRLTDSEKQARSNTALPYILSESNKANFLNNRNISSGGGQVLYTPDDDDDYDEEDPDDDLDI